MNQLQSYFDCHITQQGKDILTKIQSLTKKDYYEIFLTPIAESPLYDQVFKKYYEEKISRPISFKQIKRSLDKNAYPNLGSLFYHLYLIVNNSFLFNGRLKETTAQLATLDIFKAIIQCAHCLIPDTKQIINENNFDQVFEILETFQTSAQVIGRERVSIERRLAAVQKIRIKLKEIGEAAAKDAIEGIKQWVGEDSPGPLQLSKYGELIEEISLKLQAGNFSGKLQKMK
ncbi:Bromodomain-containing protein [Spironucleus salmonicida]|uniref:Bromodomain-containing protein n=1 Tax=Spironucleus salmonicida TaxID=348837 RepID=V6LRH4_9EUKA|nr:Bromodomain-containing protein [Spironucleus salmonicida]|eukprot:EST47160.1 Bromodomain-containing protein [Spironucleus salmonicida]